MEEKMENVEVVESTETQDNPAGLYEIATVDVTPVSNDPVDEGGLELGSMAVGAAVTGGLMLLYKGYKTVKPKVKAFLDNRKIKKDVKDADFKEVEETEDESETETETNKESDKTPNQASNKKPRKDKK